VLRCIEQAEGKHYSACNIKAAKFLHPARPGDLIEIGYARSPKGTIEFQCTVAVNTVLSGAVSATGDE
jgi:3-hydroxymyristoyl/3-hydroxydecanoyl-(acyl carrier protein) dehydratase